MFDDGLVEQILVVLILSQLYSISVNYAHDHDYDYDYDYDSTKSYS